MNKIKTAEANVSQIKEENATMEETNRGLTTKISELERRLALTCKTARRLSSGAGRVEKFKNELDELARPRISTTSSFDDSRVLRTLFLVI